jgi:hypothetical protein
MSAPLVGAVSASLESFDDPHNLFGPIAVGATELDQLTYSRHDQATFHRARHGDPTTPLELQQPFIPQDMERPKDRVLVNSEHGR